MTSRTDGGAHIKLLRSLQNKPQNALIVALLSLTGGVVVWGCFGSLKSEVEGTGMVIRGNHLYVVSSKQQGVITSQQFRLNDDVKAGKLLMSLDTSQQQIQLRANRDELKASRPLTQASLDAGQQLEAANLRQLQQAERFLADQEASLKRRIQQQQKAYEGVQALYQSGVASAGDVSATFDDLSNLKAELMQLSQAVQNSKASYHQVRQQNAANSLNLVQQNTALVAGVKGLKETVSQSMYIRAPIDGTVVGFEVTVGNLANPGDPLMTIMPSRGGLRAILLVSSNAIQRVSVGDEVLLSPSATPAVRFGYIKARVARLAKAPASQGELMKAFGSTVAVQSLMESFNTGQVNLPFLVDVEVQQDRNGLPVWTLGKQPPWGLKAGSLTSARIISDRVRPISLILPFLRQL